MKTWILIFILAAIGGGSWYYYKHRKSEDPVYTTITVGRGNLTQTITATGILNPVLNVTVGSQVSGNILKLYADWNSTVKANQIVAQIDPAIYQAQVHQCEADLASAKAALELNQLTSKRKEELVAQHAAAQADLDTAIANLHQAEASVEMKKANLELAKANLEHCTIYSPVDGIVISRSVDVGQTVAAAMNAPVLFLIANDLKKMQIDSNVAEADVGNIEVGQNVDFTVDAFPYRTFKGEVHQNRNAALTVQNVVTYDVVISVENPDLKLKPGMTANLSIAVQHRDNVIKVPNAALRFKLYDPTATPTPTPTVAEATPPPHKRSNSGRTHAEKRDRIVYVMPPEGGKPKATQVMVGLTDGVATEITDGLKEGDVLVTGSNIVPTASSAPSSNPFGGGGPRRF
jgi:HlyD family secretion protein